MKSTFAARALLRCAMTGVVALGLVAARAESEKSNSAFEFGLLGDQPYNPVATVNGNTVQSYPAVAYERLIADMNSRNLQFAVHVGDIKAGNTRCDDNVYTQNLAYFNTYRTGVVYVPGDNEWTDCHRANNGAYSPVERLAFLRSVFYPNNHTLGQRPFTVTRQEGYPENARWQVSRVIFVALNMPGSNNNQGQPSNLDAEYAARNAANLAWIEAAFAEANADPKTAGIMFFFQANPFERFIEPGQGYTVSGYSDFVTSIRQKTIAFNKPVAVAHGDTHYFRVDHPLTGTYPACAGGNQGPSPACVAVAAPTSPTDRVNNFTRTEVFGQNDVHWTKVTVDPKDPNVFSFSPMRVPGN